MSSLRTVIFDMDGLMFDTENIYSMVGTELLQRRGCQFTDDLKDEIMGLRPRPTFEAMIRRHNLDDNWEDMARESNRIFVGLLEEHLVAMPGLFELLDALEAAKIPKAIVTSSGRAMADACLSPFQLQPRFRFILAAEDIERGKPHPDVYLKAAARLELPPSETLVLEDSQNGCRAAAGAGAFTVAVPSGHSRNHDFSAASLVIDTLADPRLYETLGIEKRAL